MAETLQERQENELEALKVSAGGRLGKYWDFSRDPSNASVRPEKSKWVPKGFNWDGFVFHPDGGDPVWPRESWESVSRPDLFSDRLSDLFELPTCV